MMAAREVVNGDGDAEAAARHKWRGGAWDLAEQGLGMRASEFSGGSKIR